MKLYEKIASIQWMAVEIQKSGMNTFQKYPYKKFGDIKKAIMVEMAKLKLAILPTGEMRELVMNGSTISYIQPMAIVDGESGEKHEFQFPFVGKNTDIDKASGTAITYGLKYVLNLIALLPDESLDPDETETSKGVSKKPTKTNSSKLVEAVDKVADEREQKLSQLRTLQANVENGTNKLKMLLGIDKDESIRKESITALSLSDLDILIERMGSVE